MVFCAAKQIVSANTASVESARAECAVVEKMYAHMYNICIWSEKHVLNPQVIFHFEKKLH